MSRRKSIARLGIRPHTVRVFSEDQASGRYVRVQWRVAGALRTRSWPDHATGRREARAFAQALADELRAPAKPAPVSLGLLWARYVDAEFEALRPKTRLLYGADWRAWELFAGADTAAATVTRETLDAFRKELRKLGIAISRIRKHVELVKRVYRFGVDRELLPPTRLLDYRVKASKEERAPDTAEYRAADALKIIATLGPTESRQWRAWVFCVIAHNTGARARAILHLRWEDYTGETIRWRAEWDKVGKERVVPVPRQVQDALEIAAGWAKRAQSTSPWIFFSPKAKSAGEPVTYGGIHWMLRRAERRAGVPHVRMNAVHRFRRGVVGDVVDATGGDIRLAMAWIGDGVAQATRYVKVRDDRLLEVAALLSARSANGSDTPAATATEPQPTPEEDP